MPGCRNKCRHAIAQRVAYARCRQDSRSAWLSRQISTASGAHQRATPSAEIRSRLARLSGGHVRQKRDRVKLQHLRGRAQRRGLHHARTRPVALSTADRVGSAPSTAKTGRWSPQPVECLVEVPRQPARRTLSAGTGRCRARSTVSRGSSLTFVFSLPRQFDIEV